MAVSCCANAKPAPTWRLSGPRWRSGSSMPAADNCSTTCAAWRDVAHPPNWRHKRACWTHLCRQFGMGRGRVTVYLVGAGPGDPGLLTIRGAEVLRRADVVVHDRLSEASLLDLAPAGAERVDVGKVPGGPVQQDRINDLLIERGAAGLEVVRLKGGDPFVFGRGCEEGGALAAAGIPFEVIPGVSSAVAVPAYAGVPVTHRGLSTS